MGVIVEEVTSLDKIPVVYAVLAKVYERIQVPLAHRSLFEAAFETLYPRRMIKIFMAQAGDTYIGAAIRLFYRGVIYAWYAGTIRDYASYKGNTAKVAMNRSLERHDPNSESASNAQIDVYGVPKCP